MSHDALHSDLPVEPMGVGNPTFLLTLEAANCPPLQFLREFTVNGVEAISAYRDQFDPTFQGDVIWTIDAHTFHETGRRKLCCIDNGIGMSADELRCYINNLASSGKQQAIDRNYGIGAKVSAAGRNPHGVLYRSWKDGEGFAALLRYDRDNGQWGLHQHRQVDGTVTSVLPLSDSHKPAELASYDHGTVVTFFGQSDEDDTSLPIEGASRERWIRKALNSRLYELPDYVSVKVREEREGAGEIVFRTVNGLRYYLDQHTMTSGSVPVVGAEIHWRILDERHEERRKQGGEWASTGHRAALFGGELYELTTLARGATQRLQEFGIRFGHGRVVVHAEPQVTGSVQIDPARAQLKIDGEPLPWLRYGQEFEENMPDALRAFQESLAAPRDQNHGKSIRERLQSIAELFRVPRYKPNPDGKALVKDPAEGGAPGQLDDQRHAPPTRRTPSGGGSAGAVYSMFVVREGNPAIQVEPEALPDLEVDWISVDEGTRTPPDLEDLAADYDRRHSFLRINADFRGYRGMVERWTKRYHGVPGARGAIEQQVREWWEQALTETVLGVLALRGSEVWHDRRVEEALSPTSLTASVMQRYHLEMTLKRELASRLKPLREVA